MLEKLPDSQEMRLQVDAMEMMRLSGEMSKTAESMSVIAKKLDAADVSEEEKNRLGDELSGFAERMHALSEERNRLSALSGISTE